MFKVFGMYNFAYGMETRSFLQTSCLIQNRADEICMCCHRKVGWRRHWHPCFSQCQSYLDILLYQIDHPRSRYVYPKLKEILQGFNCTFSLNQDPIWMSCFWKMVCSAMQIDKRKLSKSETYIHSEYIGLHSVPCNVSNILYDMLY